MQQTKEPDNMNRRMLFSKKLRLTLINFLANMMIRVTGRYWVVHVNVIDRSDAEDCMHSVRDLLGAIDAIGERRRPKEKEMPVA